MESFIEVNNNTPFYMELEHATHENLNTAFIKQDLLVIHAAAN